MLVAGQRDGFNLIVHQAWRIYPSRVSLAGTETPVDCLRRFADVYGAEIEVAGKRGSFFLFSDGPIPDRMRWTTQPKRDIIISMFDQKDIKTGRRQASLIVGVDIFRYQAMLNEMFVKREDMIDEFVPAPRPRD